MSLLRSKSPINRHTSNFSILCFSISFLSRFATYGSSVMPSYATTIFHCEKEMKIVRYLMKRLEKKTRLVHALQERSENSLKIIIFTSFCYKDCCTMLK